MTHTTHKWGEPITYQYKTERACIRPGCDLVKVTRHEARDVWREWWRNGKQIKSDTTPPCIGEIEVAGI